MTESGNMKQTYHILKILKNAILSDNVNVLKIETDKMKDNIRINQTKLKNL